MRIQDRQKLMSAKNNLERAVDSLNKIEREVWQGVWGDQTIREYVREAKDLAEKGRNVMIALLNEVR